MSTHTAAADRGFTLIELLVVVAIIGLLSSIVLASLNAARVNGADAATKSGLANARSQADLFYSVYSTGSYATVCMDTTVAGVKSIHSMVQAAAVAAGLGSFTRDADGDLVDAVCNDTTSAWAAQVKLRSGGYFCVDNTGKAMESMTSRITTTTDRAC